jgi:hypothetical protein
MFAKLAKFRTIEAIDRGHTRRLATIVPACNDNHRAGFSAGKGQRLHRPVLGCRWVKGRAGALECIWHVETVEESVIEEPLRRRWVGQAQWSAAA